ncbi:major tail protein [Gordonia phage Ayotoya]|nr:major tail protein [Gordonia phage Ayotoya]URP21243.1 major tail protein [Gordonia phage Chop]UXL91291.1 major tail protein [Gordonia phage GrandSlam]
MAGNADNVKLWDGADVLIFTGSGVPSSTATPATLPATITDDWPTDWKYVGLLKGDSGFQDSREWSETDIPAWGYGTVKVSSKDFKDTRKFTAIEDNETTFGLIWPGSDDTKIVVPKPANRFIAFQLVDDDGGKVRYISKRKARIWAPNWNQVEGQVDGYEFDSRIFPDSNKELYRVQKAAA